MDQKLFGKNIADCRKLLGMTQAQLADQLHVTASAVSKWERGLSYPDVTLLQPLADILQISTTELLGNLVSGGADSAQPKDLFQNSIQAVVDISIENQRRQRNHWRIVVGFMVLVILVVLGVGIRNIFLEKQHPYRDHVIQRTAIEYAEHSESGDLIYIYDEANRLLRLTCPEGVNIDSFRVGWHRIDSSLVHTVYELEYALKDESCEGILFKYKELEQYEDVTVFGLFPEKNQTPTEKDLFGFEQTFIGMLDNAYSTYFYALPTEEYPLQRQVLMVLKDEYQVVPYEIDDYDADGINELLISASREIKPYVLYDIAEDGDIIATWYDQTPNFILK